jgi:hypothetical protein
MDLREPRNLREPKELREPREPRELREPKNEPSDYLSLPATLDCFF